VRVFVRRVAVPTAAIVALWIACELLAARVVEVFVGPGAGERLMPFANAHLLEEAVEGEYAPVTDPVFLANTLLLAVVAFGAGSCLAGRGVPRVQRLYAAIPSLVTLVLLAWLFRHVWNAGYPSPMRVAFAIQFGACFAASCAGLWWCWPRENSRSREVG